MRTHRQSGFVIIVSVAVIGVLVAVFGYMIQNSYRRTMLAELQAAADAAAHAGARSLSSTIAGFEAARGAAALELPKHTIHRGFGRPKALSALDPANGPTWEIPDEYTVTIIRGAWWPDGAPDADADGQPGNGYGEKFLALEDAQGQPLAASPLAPSLPAFIAANAVSVTVTLKKTKGPFSFLGDMDVKASAIAVGGALGAVTTAPFAIPVCSLLAGTSDYSPQNRCAYDIYFTRRDRYCPPDDPRCGAKPGFFAQLDQPNGGRAVLEYSEQCSFATESISTDYLYGFVVGPDQFTSEAAMRGNDFKLMTKIGGRVTIREEGFTEAPSGEWMSMLMASGSRTTSIMSQERGIGAGSYTLISKIPTASCGGQDVGLGACNTTGFRFDQDNWVSNSFHSCSVANVLAAPDSSIVSPDFGGYWPGPEHSDAYQSVWTVKASVVVWDGMGDCTGTNGATQDPPPPPPGTELTVIGFLDVDVYGVDVGQEPPRPPDTIYSKGHSYWRDEMSMCQGCDGQCPEVSYECQGRCGSAGGCESECEEVNCATCDADCGSVADCAPRCAAAEATCHDSCAGCERRCEDSVADWRPACERVIAPCVATCNGNVACEENCTQCRRNIDNHVAQCKLTCVGCDANCTANANSQCIAECAGSIEGCKADCPNCPERVRSCKEECHSCDSSCTEHADCVQSCEAMQSYSCNYKNPHSCDPDGAGSAPNEMESSHAPWGFTPPVAASEPNFKCNLIRARTHCQDDFLPAIQNGQARDITIVK